MMRWTAMLTALILFNMASIARADEYNRQSDQLYQATGQSNPVVRWVQKYVPAGGTTVDEDYRGAGGNPSGNTDNNAENPNR